MTTPESSAGTTIVLGQQLYPGVTDWQDFGLAYSYNAGQHLLVMSIANPSADTIEKFSDAAIHVGVHSLEHVLFFIYKFEGVMDWSDQAFSLGFVPEGQRHVPDLADGERILLPIVLVDAKTGVVMAMRAATYPLHISRLITKALKKQEAKVHEFSERGALSIIAAVHERYPTSSAMVRNSPNLGRMGV